MSVQGCCCPARHAAIVAQLLCALLPLSWLLQPHLIQASRNGINLHPQRGNGPAVDDIAARHQQADQAVGGQHQSLINIQQAELTRLNIWDIRQEEQQGIEQLPENQSEVKLASKVHRSTAVMCSLHPAKLMQPANT